MKLTISLRDFACTSISSIRWNIHTWPDNCAKIKVTLLISECFDIQCRITCFVLFLFIFLQSENKITLQNFINVNFIKYVKVKDMQSY